jgi:hypothetical protein
MTSNMGAHIIQERFSKITDDNAFDTLFETKEEVMELLKTNHPTRVSQPD